MTGVTAGQAARDVVAAHLQRQLPPEIPMSWDNVSAEDRAVWEVAARAAIDAGTQPAPELAAALAEVRQLRELLAEVLDSYEACDDRGPATRTQLAKWRKRLGAQ